MLVLVFESVGGMNGESSEGSVAVVSAPTSASSSA